MSTSAPRIGAALALLAAVALVPFGCARGAAVAPPSPAATIEIERARDLTAAGDWDGALDAWRRAVEVDPASADAAIGAADLLARLTLAVDAVVMYEMAARRAARDPRPYLRLAALYAATGRLEIAKTSLEAAEKVAPGHPEVLVASGRRRLEVGDLWGAASAIGAAVRARPQDAAPRHLSGMLEWRRQAFGEASAQLRRAVELDPQCWPAAVDLARLLSELGGSRDGLAVLVRARAAVEPDPAELVREMASLQSKLGRQGIAADLAAEADRLALLEAAVASLADRLWTEPTDGDLRRQLGEALIAAGRLDDAEGALRGWARLQPERGAPWRAIAEVCASRRDERGAAFARLHGDQLEPPGERPAAE